jgi:hypothetical protein
MPGVGHLDSMRLDDFGPPEGSSLDDDSINNKDVTNKS